MVEGSDTFETVFVSRSGKTVPCEVLEHSIEYVGVRVILSVARDITDPDQNLPVRDSYFVGLLSVGLSCMAHQAAHSTISL